VSLLQVVFIELLGFGSFQGLFEVSYYREKLIKITKELKLNFPPPVNKDFFI